MFGIQPSHTFRVMANAESESKLGSFELLRIDWCARDGEVWLPFLLSVAGGLGSHKTPTWLG